MGEVSGASSLSARVGRALLLPAAAGVFLVATWLDPWAHEVLRYENLDRPTLAELDWQRLLRVFGTLWLWLGLAVVFVIVDVGRPTKPRMRDHLSRGALVLIAPALGGLAAEILKVVFSRARPPRFAEVFEYAAHNPAGLSTSNLGLPSSHAAVAAAGLFALARIEPRLAIPMLLVALASGLARVGSGAHYLSDAALGLMVGAACGQLIWMAHLRMLAGASSRLPPHSSGESSPTPTPSSP